MKKFLERDSNNITISQFFENHKLGKYNYDPDCQRLSVWNDGKKSFLIDSILKNFPIPPIFLRQIIDSDTGITKYEVIDGKQRLQSIVSYIENNIPLPNDFGSGEFGNEELNGLYFKDLDKYPEYKRSFWKYSISIEYLYTESSNVIDNVFDRLNRNGTPLTNQELRKAKYHDTLLLSLIDDLANSDFWKERLKKLETHRMEDKEFISEILFAILENGIIDSSPDSINALYEKWSKADREDELKSSIELFMETTNYIAQLDLDYEQLKITGVSHLYGLWFFAFYCVNEGIPVKLIKNKLNKMYISLRNRNYENSAILLYRKSMDSRTRSHSQRLNRVNALIKYCKV